MEKLEKKINFAPYLDEEKEIFFSLMEVGQNFKRIKNYEQAEKIYDIIEKKFGEYGVLCVAKAKNYICIKRFDEALILMKKAYESYDGEYIDKPDYDKNLNEHHIYKLTYLDRNSDEFIEYVTGISGDNSYDYIYEEKYKEGIVIFLDLLGTKANQDNLKKTFEIFNLFFERTLNLKKQNPRDKEFIRQVFAFSDCCYIVYKPRYKRTSLETMIFNSLHDISEMLCKLLLNKIIFRGGISFGNLLTKGNFAFGPAFNKAYELESKKANYIRVVIDEKLANIIKKSNLIKKQKELEKIIKYDKKDKLYYLNIFVNTEVGYKYDSEIELGYLLKDTKSFIENKISELDKKIQAKNKILKSKKKRKKQNNGTLRFKYKRREQEKQLDEYIKIKYEWFMNYLNGIKIADKEKGTVINGILIKSVDEMK